MEPTDFDKILRDKIHENRDLHTKEMDKAKPFVWAAVYNEIGKKKSLSWYHLAAATALLLITFSVVLYRVQSVHRQELASFSRQLDQLEKSYQSQAELLEMKNSQLVSLTDKLDGVEQQFNDLQHRTPALAKERIVYQRDTVFLKQVEYVTVATDTNKINHSINKNADLPQREGVTLVGLNENKIDDVIYPSPQDTNKKQKTESIRVRFSSFTARSN
jgi:hypothetical protein